MSTPKHLEAAPAGLRLARIVLIVGAVLSAAAAVGGVWLIRAAVVLALVAGVLAAVFLVRELRARADAQHRLLREADQRHRAQFSAERSRNAAVLVTLDDRLSALRARIEQLQGELGHRDQMITALRAREASLTRQLWHEGVLERAEWATAAPKTVVGDDDHADVHTLPRHGVSRATAVPDRSWGNLEVELPVQRTGS